MNVYVMSKGAVSALTESLAARFVRGDLTAR